MSTILLDIEGTTTSIDFVHKTLFPYSLDHMESFLKKNQTKPEVREALASLGEKNVALAAEMLKQWIRDDRKEPVLKTLQGLIWQEGYKSGALKSHVYDDVPRAFESWSSEGHRLGIYSSGSVLSQRLIFAHSNHGDLNHFLSFNFDTAVGAKRDKASYERIASQLKTGAGDILFLSDIADELYAARAAGFRVMQIVREGTKPDGKLPMSPDLLHVAVGDQDPVLKKFFLNNQD